MNSHKRAAIAYIIAQTFSERSLSSIYSYSDSKHFSFSGTVDDNGVNIYDYQRSCHIGGSIDSLYDYGTSKHIQLKIEGDTFSGYDYDVSKHFSGTINNGGISIYDYEFSKHFSYSL